MSLSMGVSVYPVHGKNQDELLLQADKALCIAKKGESKIQVGEGGYRLDERVVSMVYQPIIELETLRVLGYEALSRDGSHRYGVAALFKKYQSIGKLDEFKVLCFNVKMREAEKLGLRQIFLYVDFSVLRTLGSLKKPSAMEVI